MKNAHEVYIYFSSDKLWCVSSEIAEFKIMDKHLALLQTRLKHLAVQSYNKKLKKLRVYKYAKHSNIIDVIYTINIESLYYAKQYKI